MSFSKSNVQKGEFGYENEEKQVSVDRSRTHTVFVPRVGIEPTLQWNTSLSRARLPIPPPRLVLEVANLTKKSWNKTYLSSSCYRYVKFHCQIELELIFV